MALLESKVVVITGSAIGIGRAIAEACAREGADVALLDIDTLHNAETASLVRATRRKALALDCDIADKGQVRRAFNDIYQQLGRVDLLVNNAAVYIDCALTHGDWDTQTRNFERSLEIGANGTYYCSLAAVPLLRAGGGGNIVNLITEHVHEGYYMTTSPATGYDCAKFSQWRLTEAWALELAPHNIRVNALCPGATDTPMLRAVSVPIAEAGMRPQTVAEGVLNILRQGAGGPSGKAYLIGPTQTALSPGGTTGPRDVAGILTA